MVAVNPETVVKILSQKVADLTLENALLQARVQEQENQEKENEK